MTIPSAAEYTAGPWTIGRYGDIEGPNGEAIRAKGIALTNTPVALANARLIAAAPEMLDALEAARGFVRQHYAPAIDSEHALMEKIMSAIAKATGAKP